MEHTDQTLDTFLEELKKHSSGSSGMSPNQKLDSDLFRYSAAPGISGREAAPACLVRGQVEELGYTLTEDPLGNLCYHKGEPDPLRPRLMISAHLDEVGLMATYLEEDGMVRFTCVGGIDARVLPGRAVYLPRSHCYGVIGVKPIHLVDSAQRGKAVSVEDLVLDLGADSKEETQTLVQPGDQIVFDCRGWTEQGSLVRGKALDDRVGCVILMQLMEQLDDPNITFCFLTQEEVGCRGAKAAAERIRPDYSIVLEATTAADLPEVPEQKQVCQLGKGAVVGFMDRSTIYSRNLYQTAFELAQRQNIPIQTKTMVAGGNDAGAIHTAAGGVQTLAISVPCRYLHSPSCVIDPKDAYAVRDLAKVLAQEMVSGRLSREWDGQEIF